MHTSTIIVLILNFLPSGIAIWRKTAFSNAAIVFNAASVLGALFIVLVNASELPVIWVISAWVISLALAVSGGKKGRGTIRDFRTAERSDDMPMKPLPEKGFNPNVKSKYWEGDN